MTESRWQRWSRKKTEARQEAEPAPLPPVDSEPAPEEQELAINETLSEQEVLAKYDLPDPDSIQMGTDITGFMRKEIPELLRRKALRSLWKSNPVLAVLDGLNDYDEDFTDAAPGVKGAKTIYQVGKGLFDKSARKDQEPEQGAAVEVASSEGPTVESAPVESAPVESAPVESAATAEPKAIAEERRESNPLLPREANRNEQTAPQVADTEPEPTPRYRPRMRFD